MRAYMYARVYMYLCSYRCINTANTYMYICFTLLHVFEVLFLPLSGQADWFTVFAVISHLGREKTGFRRRGIMLPLALL